MDFWGTPNIQTVTSLSKGNFYSTYVTMWFEDRSNSGMGETEGTIHPQV